MGLGHQENLGETESFGYLFQPLSFQWCVRGLTLEVHLGVCASGCHCYGADPGGKYYAADGHLDVAKEWR